MTSFITQEKMKQKVVSSLPGKLKLPGQFRRDINLKCFICSILIGFIGHLYVHDDTGNMHRGEHQYI